MFMEMRRGVVEKLQLLEITLAPDTNQEMQPHLESCAQGERPFQGLRRQPRHLRAIQRVVPHPCGPARLKPLEEFHSDSFCFANQFVSRHRRNAMRARCNITHKLFSEMLRTAQISLLATPSTSRKVKTAATFLGSLVEQSWNVCQKTSLSKLAPGLDHSCGPSS